MGFVTSLNTLPEFALSIPCVQKCAPHIHHGSFFLSQELELFKYAFSHQSSIVSRAEISEWSQDDILDEPWQSHLRSIFELSLCPHLIRDPDCERVLFQWGKHRMAQRPPRRSKLPRKPSQPLEFSKILKSNHHAKGTPNIKSITSSHLRGERQIEESIRARRYVFSKPYLPFLASQTTKTSCGNDHSRNVSRSSTLTGRWAC